MEGQQPRWVYWEVSHPYCFQNHTVYKTWPLELLYCICLDALSLSLTRNKDYLASVHGCSIRFSCVIYPSCPPEELFLLSEQKVTQGNASSQKLQASREKPSLTEHPKSKHTAEASAWRWLIVDSSAESGVGWSHDQKVLFLPTAPFPVVPHSCENTHFPAGSPWAE